MHYPRSEPIGITAAIGTQTIIQAPTNDSAGNKRSIWVTAVVIGVTVAGTVQFQSHTTTAIKTGAIPIGANVPMVANANDDAWFKCAPGEALDLVVTGAANVCGGTVNYIIV